MPEVGDLVRCTEDRWMILAPQRCPNGHAREAGRCAIMVCV